MAHQYPGILIAVEGIDGAGKSSLITRLTPFLGTLQYTVVPTKEPGGTRLGAELRTLLQYQPIPIAPRAECLLFAADRAQHFHEIVIPALKNGSLVVSDRMGDSSLAYQGFGRGHDFTIVKIINQWTMQGIEPDLTIYLKIPVDLAYERMELRNTKKTVFESQKREFLERVARGFDQLYKDTNRTDLIIIDATKPQEVVVNETFNSIQIWLKNRTRS